MKPIALVAILVATALAGCAEEGGGGDTPSQVDPDSVEIESGKGAIQGLLIDDRFRPIADGTVLLQPVGQTTTSNENGEFLFLDLEPGAYTMKVSAEGHEASPQTVNVQEGEFTDANLVARRIINEAGAILTREFSVFVPCAADFVVNGVVWDCTLDLSGDTYRPGFTVNYTDIDNVTFLVAEAKMNQVGNYNIQVRENDGSPAGGQRYAVADIYDTDYVKIVLEVGVKNEEWNGQENNVPWNNTKDTHTIVFMTGDYQQEAQDTGDNACNPSVPQTCRNYRGAGFKSGIRAKFVHSLFLGEPDVDIASYALLE